MGLLAALVAMVVSIGGAAGRDTGEVDATYGDTRRCVTEREMKQLRLDMPKHRVHEIIDGSGKQTFLDPAQGAAPKLEGRRYRHCDGLPDWYLKVWYANDRVAYLNAWTYYTFF